MRQIYSNPRLWVIIKRDQFDYALYQTGSLGEALDSDPPLAKSRDYNELMAIAEKNTEWL